MNDDDDYDDDYYIIKQLNNHFKTIDETKSFKEQIEILKTKDFLDEYWHFGYLDEQLIKKIFGHTFVALVDKLINTIGEEENKIIIDDIKKIETKSRSKMYVVSLLSIQPINVMIYSMLLKLF